MEFLLWISVFTDKVVTCLYFSEFSWDDVKVDKHRENYLGHSVKAPVGRWQKGSDLHNYIYSIWRAVLFVFAVNINSFIIECAFLTENITELCVAYYFSNILKKWINTEGIAGISWMWLLYCSWHNPIYLHLVMTLILATFGLYAKLHFHQIMCLWRKMFQLDQTLLKIARI